MRANEQNLLRFSSKVLRALHPWQNCFANEGKVECSIGPKSRQKLWEHTLEPISLIPLRLPRKLHTQLCGWPSNPFQNERQNDVLGEEWRGQKKAKQQFCSEKPFIKFSGATWAVFSMWDKSRDSSVYMLSSWCKVAWSLWLKTLHFSRHLQPTYSTCIKYLWSCGKNNLGILRSDPFCNCGMAEFPSALIGQNGKWLW